MLLWSQLSIVDNDGSILSVNTVMDDVTMESVSIVDNDGSILSVNTVMDDVTMESAFHCW